MTRLYSEMLCLFFRFYAARSDRNPLVSAGMMISAVQTVCVAAGVLLLVGSDVVSIETRHQWYLVLGAGVGLSLCNWIYLKDGRAEHLIEQVDDPRCIGARWALVAVTAVTALAILFYKGLLRP